MKVMTLFTLTGFLIILVAFSFVTTNDPASDSREPQDSQVVHEQLAEGDSTEEVLDESESRQKAPPAPEQVEITVHFLLGTPFVMTISTVIESTKWVKMATNMLLVFHKMNGKRIPLMSLLNLTIM